LRFHLPGIGGDFDAGDLYWKVGRSASTAGVGTSSSPTASAPEDDLPGRRHANQDDPFCDNY
jgi:hypothetical protein